MTKEKTYKLLQQRTHKDDVQTRAAWYVFEDGVLIYKCFALELPDKGNQRRVSCIPEDKYKARKCLGSHSFKYVHFDILGVPDRDCIKIHIGNFIDTIKQQSAGCQFPGSRFGDINGDGYVEILDSKATLQRLVEILPDEFIIEIRYNGNI